ncbi:hypothetical protein J6590_094981 [Homalodisca vitripennis]|nr:hypothetical protein J6590_094981 [Homalodisca vitripennis]
MLVNCLRYSAPPALLTTVPKLAPAAADGGSAVTTQQSPRHQDVTYAEALRGSPTPGSSDKNGRSPESKNMDTLVGGKPD